MSKIVVVDDEDAFRRAITRTLKAAGYEVISYADGGSATANLAADAPDLVITDIFMPEMEGIETIRRISAKFPGLPIIAVSGVQFEGSDYLQIAEKFGAAAVLRKPFPSTELLQLVAQLLQNCDT